MDKTGELEHFEYMLKLAERDRDPVAIRHFQDEILRCSNPTSYAMMKSRRAVELAEEGRLRVSSDE